MQAVLIQDDEAVDLAAAALGERPVRAVRQTLTASGKAVHRLDLPDGRTVVLRASDSARAFAYTPGNLEALRSLGLPVQTVLASGPTPTGGSYVILDWLPGRDLVYELGGMTRGQMSRLAEQVVDCQRRVGRLPAALRFGWAPVGRSGSLRTWTEMFGEAASPEAADDGTPVGRLRARLCALRRRVEPYFTTVRPTPFLDDLTTKNVLVECGVLRGIIDVDFVCHGDPLLATGATMAAIAGDVPEAGAAFYGEELVRCWNPDADQRLAVWFYAALWAIGSLGQTDAAARPARARSLFQAADGWLSAAEADRGPVAAA